MPRPKNPRFPHTCTITRYADTDPMEDQPDIVDPIVDDDPMIDEEPVYEEVTEDTEQENGENEDTEEEEGVTVIYEGECRAYDKNTTSDKGDVITSYRGLALPLTRDDWEALGVVPQEGDRIVVDRGGYTEYGVVIDKNPGNFGGTHLVWKYGRN